MAGWLFWGLWFAATGAMAQDGGASLDPVSGQDGVIQAAVGEPIELTVLKRRLDVPVVGEAVEWRLEEPDAGRIERLDEVTRAAGDDPGAGQAGTARARFIAAGPGRFAVEASTLRVANCAGPDCARLAYRFVVEVRAAEEVAGQGKGNLVLAAAGGAVALAAITTMDGGGSDGLSSAASLAIVGGNGQTALANTAPAQPLVVMARNGTSPASGVTIQWQASGGATISGGSSTTGADGRATINVTNIGPGPGPVTITATRGDSAASSVQFTLTVNIADFQLVSGNNQTTRVDTAAAAPLVVRTLVNGAPQAGIAVQWQVVSGLATVASGTSTSDASGLANMTVTGGSFPGNVTVLARRADAPHLTQSFSLTVVELRGLDVVSGDGQSGAQLAALPTPLVVLATDDGLPEAGVTLFWSASPGTVLSTTSTVTDAAGEANVTVTSLPLTIGPTTVTVVRSDQPAISTSFTLNVLPPTMGGTTGDGQQGLTGQAATAPLEVTLLDAAGNPMPGQTVTWQVMSGSATLQTTMSITDAAGVASVNFSFGLTPGPVQIQASAFAGAATAAFTATTLPPGAMAVQGGDGQVGDPGDVLPLPLIVRIPGPAPDLSGVPVTFTVVSGSATLAPMTVLTDVNGDAATTVTLGLTPGPVVIQATAPGGVVVTFGATVTGTLVVSGITAAGGDGQSLTPGQPSAPMVIELIGNGVPLAGETVQWSTSSGTLAAATTITDANGRTSNTVTVQGAGAVTVTATFPTVAAFVGSSLSFTHNVGLAALPSLSINEASVAEALDAACGQLVISGPLTPDEQDLLEQCQALTAASATDPTAVGEALTAMLPDVAQTQADASKAAVGAQFDNLNGRIMSLRSGAPVAPMSLSGLSLQLSGGRMPLGLLGNVLALGQDPDGSEPAFADSRWGIFVSGNIGRAESAPNRLTPKFDVDIEGLTLGVDFRHGDSLIIGAALGYTRQDSRLANDLGQVETNGFSLSGYSTWYQKNNWYLDSVLTYGSNQYDHARSIRYELPTEVVDQVALASSDGDDLSLTATYGRDFAWRGFTFGLFGRAAYSRLGFDEFQERVDESINGNGLALRVQARDVTALAGVLGGSASYAYSASWGVISPRLDVEWVKDFRSDAEAFRGFFLDDPTQTPILVLGGDQDSDYLRLGFSLAFMISGGRSGFISYERTAARDGQSQEGLTLGVRWEF